MVQLICGDQFLCDEHIKKQMNAYDLNDDLNVMFCDSWEADVQDFCNCYPFMASKKICVLKTKELNNNSSLEALSIYVKNPCETTDLIICLEKLDGRMKLVKYMKEQKLVHEYGKLSLAATYERLERRLVDEYGFCCDEVRKFKKLFEKRLESYISDDEYDLYQVMRNVDMLGYQGELTEELIIMYFPESLQVSVFELSKLLFDGKREEMLNFAKKLIANGENAINLLSTVISQVRYVYKASLFPEKNRNDVTKLLNIRSFQLHEVYKKYDSKVFAQMYCLLQSGVNQIKQGKDAEDTVLITLIKAAECMV